jgi:hypothetical protein
MVKLDPEAPFAALHLFSLACWPKDHLSRGAAQVTWAAAINGINEAIGLNADNMESLLQAGAAEAAAEMGLTAESLLTLPHAKETAERVRSMPGDFTKLVMRMLFEPGGGWLSIANTSYQGDVGKKQEAASKGGFVAGYVVLYCAILRHHHPQRTASYNRAQAIIEELCRRNVIHVGGDRSRKDAWKAWRGVGHIWAAILLALERDSRPGAPADSFNPGLGLRRTLAWAAWFREFATTHRAASSQRRLVLDQEAIELVADVQPQQPPLEPLTGYALKAALDYRAPIPI